MGAYSVIQTVQHAAHDADIYAAYEKYDERCNKHAYGGEQLVGIGVDPQVFATAKDAEDYISENTEKWSGGMGVFYISKEFAQPSAKVFKKRKSVPMEELKESGGRLGALLKKRSAISEEIDELRKKRARVCSDAVRTFNSSLEPGKTVRCKKCSTRFTTETVRSFFGGKAACLVCRESLLGQPKEVAGIDRKTESLEKKRAAMKSATHGMFGGWAAC